MKPAGLYILRWAAESSAALCGMHCRRILALTDASTLVIHLSGRQDRFLILPDSSATPLPRFVEDKKELAAFPGERRATEKFNRLPRRRLLDIEAFPGDRKLVFSFGARPDKPEDEQVRLVLHLMGEPQCLLINAQDIILETSRVFKKFPVGSAYAPPRPPELANPLTIAFPEFARLWRSEDVECPEEFLRRKIWGIDEELAALLLPREGAVPAAATAPDRQLWEFFSSLKTAIRGFLDLANRFQVDPNSRVITAVVPAASSSAGKSINQVINDWSTTSVRDERRDKIALEWQRIAGTHLKKIGAAQKALNTRKDEADKAGLFKEYADILSINRHRIQKGTSRVELPNPYAESAPVSIELDPAKSLQANIEAYYKKHRRSLAAQKTLLAEEKRLDLAAGLLREIVATVTEEDLDESALPLDEWRRKLTELGLRIPHQSSAGTGATGQRRLAYREFTLEGGEIVWVGRSARDNDELTVRLAAKSDWFFHARQAAGAHVILKHGQSSAPPPASVVRQAAAVAAFFSEAKHSAVVPVVYAPIKYVRKARKAPPGTVNLLREESVFVEPAPPPRYHDRRESR